jgi:phage terminase small subunit
MTAQQELFCLEYVKDLNGTQAAIRAGYSPKTAQEQASRLLSKAIISERLQALLDARFKRVQLDGDTILRELLRLATSDLRKLFDDKGGLLPPHQWPDDAAVAVSSVEVEELFDGYGEERHQIGFTKKVKFWDKPKSLELLGKHLKLFIEQVNHTGKLTIEDLVIDSDDKKSQKEDK